MPSPLQNIEGELAQLVERVLSMHEVAGSIPAFSMLSTILEISLFQFHIWPSQLDLCGLASMILTPGMLDTGWLYNVEVASSLEDIPARIYVPT